MMTQPETPEPYRTNRDTRTRFDEGWQDGRAGRPHAHAGHAEAIIRQYGASQYAAYTAGYAAGVAAERAEPGLLAWAHQVLDTLEQADLSALTDGQRAELAARLSAQAAALSARRSTP